MSVLIKSIFKKTNAQKQKDGAKIRENDEVTKSSLQLLLKDYIPGNFIN